MSLASLNKDLQKLKQQSTAQVYARFFKTQKGEYGEKDSFLGISVPEQRKLAKKYIDLDFEDLEKLLNSKWHEYRLTAVLILTYKYNYADPISKREIFNFYLKHLQNINSWDLVDLSAHKIIGAFLYEQADKKNTKNILDKLVQSKNFWERRVAIIATFYYLKQYKYENTLRIARLLLKDEHDLIHKAVGWMLREVGKRNQKKEEVFLSKYSKLMPRTMLRYATEKFSEEKKKQYLQK